jgi:uncharacterized protein (TIGR03435 family)
MEKELYDVEAKPAAQSGNYVLRHTRFGIGDERVRLMLQTLLAERFHLRVHRQVKAGDIWLLEKSGKPLLLKASNFSEDRPVMGTAGFSGQVEHVGGHIYLFDTSIPQLASFASNYILHKPVLDQTGLSGSFDYRDADAKVPQESDFEGNFLAFIRNVGLKLTRSKGSVETLVIESAEKPSGN